MSFIKICRIFYLLLLIGSPKEVVVDIIEIKKQKKGKIFCPDFNSELDK